MFAKLFSSITESSLWSEPKEVRLLFVSMLARADQNGFVESSLPGLARVSNLTLEETELAIGVLMSPDKYSKNPANDGKRVEKVPGGYVLLNYEDYRSRRSSEERREYMREYMQEYRKNSTTDHQRKQNVNSVNHGKPPLAYTETETETEKKQTVEKPKRQKTGVCQTDFSRFWQVYPKRQAKGSAEKAWVQSVKIADPEDIIAAAGVYAEHCKTKDKQYVKNPATWLNAKCWEDEIEPPVKSKQELQYWNRHDSSTAEGRAAIEREFLENLHT